MRLATKTALLVGGLMSVTMAARSIVASRVVEENFETVERASLEETTNSVRTVMLALVDDFQQRGTDWAEWDDMATFLDEANAAFRDSNLTPAGFANVGWDHIVVLRRDRTRVFSARLEPARNALGETSTDLDRLIDDGTLAPPDDDVLVAGFAELGGELHLVASRPIHRTDHSPGPSRGRLVTSRSVGEDWRARVEGLTLQHVAIHPLSRPPDTARTAEGRRALDDGEPIHVGLVGAGELAGLTRVPDVRGNPLFDLEVLRKRAYTQAAEELSSQLNRLSTLGGLVLLLVALVATRRFVVHPLTRLLRGIEAMERGELVEVKVSSHDELGHLASTFNRMSLALREREDALHRVLDGTGDGLAWVGLDGVVGDVTSAAAGAWLGAPDGRKLWAWLPLDDTRRECMALDFAELASDTLPFDFYADQLPSELRDHGRILRIRYKPLRERDRLIGVLVNIRDATSEDAAERGEEDRRELAAIAGLAIRDHRAVVRIGADLEDHVAKLSTSRDERTIKRTLHTIRGIAAVSGLESVATAARRAEDALAEDTGDARLAVDLLVTTWCSTRERLGSFFAAEATERIAIDEGEYSQLLRAVYDPRVAPELRELVESWQRPLAETALERLARQAERMAQRQGKEVDVVVEHGGLRLPRRDLDPLLASFVHVLRNAVDHGIEGPEERTRAGKPSRGTIHLAVRKKRDRFLFALSDDGRGIDWDRVHARAAQLGLPHASPRELEEALFADGFSTRTEVGELSGRGVGLSAARAECLALGGDVELESRLGHGTRLSFSLPLSTGPSANAGTSHASKEPRPSTWARTR